MTTLPILRRNRGTLICVELPVEVGNSVTLVHEQKDLQEANEDSHVLVVKLEISECDSTIRFKHARGGARRMPVTNNKTRFEMIVEAHRSAKNGTIHARLYHKVDQSNWILVGSGSIDAEVRSEKGPKDEIDMALDLVTDGKPELMSLDGDSTSSSFSTPIPKIQHLSSTMARRSGRRSTPLNRVKESQNQSTPPPSQIEAPSKASAYFPTYKIPQTGKFKSLFHSSEEEEEEEEVILESLPNTAPTSPASDFHEENHFSYTQFINPQFIHPQTLGMLEQAAPIQMSHSEFTSGIEPLFSDVANEYLYE